MIGGDWQSEIRKPIYW